jgi:hypothetical protein
VNFLSYSGMDVHHRRMGRLTSAAFSPQLSQGLAWISGARTPVSANIGNIRG